MLQGGSKGAAGKSAKYIETGGTDVSGAKFGQSGGVNAAKGGTVNVTNNGLSGDVLTQLVGSLTSAQPAQVDALSSPQPSPFAQAFEAPPADQAATAGASQPSSHTWYWVGGGVLALIVLIFLFKK